MSRFLDNATESTVDLKTGNTDIDVNVISSKTLKTETGTFSGDIQCQNMTVLDTIIAANIHYVDEFKIKDAILEIGSQNTTNAINMGFIEHYNDGNPKYAGIIRSKDDNKQYIISNSLEIPILTSDIRLLNRGSLVVSNLDASIVNSGDFDMVKAASKPAASTGKVRLYASSVDNQLHIVDDSGIDTPVSVSFNQSLNITDDTQFEKLTIKKSSDSSRPILSLERERGSAFNPETVSNGDVLGDIQFKGRNIGRFTQNACNISAVAEEDFLINANGSRLTFSTTNIGSSNLSEKLKINTDGITINTGTNSFTLPNSRGLNNQVLSQTSSGQTDWLDLSTTNVFDQNLNSYDDVEFNKLSIPYLGNIKFGSSAAISAISSTPIGANQTPTNFTLGWRFTPSQDIYIKAYKVSTSHWLSSNTTKQIAIWEDSNANLMGPGVVLLDKSRNVNGCYIKDVPIFLLSAGVSYVIASFKTPNDKFDASTATFPSQITNVKSVFIEDNTFQKPNANFRTNSTAVFGNFDFSLSNDVKISSSSSGYFTINDGNDSISFPSNRGLLNQVLQTDSLGILTWKTPFIPYQYNYQTLTSSTTLFNAATPTTIITATGEETKLTVAQAGTYRASFDSEISLQGNLPQTLSAKATAMVNELSGLPYTTLTIAPDMTLTAGNYKTVGASTITGTFTLNGTANDIFVVYINGALNMVSNSSIVLAGSTQLQNVFFIVNGAFSTASPTIFNGQLFALTSIGFVGANTVEGRVISLGGAISYGSGTNPPSMSPDDSPLIQFGVLDSYSTYTIAGDISHLGSSTFFSGLILTGLGNISGLGGFNGNYTTGVVQPSIMVEFGLYVGDTLVEVSKRCIHAPICICHETHIVCNLLINSGEVISVRIQTMLNDTSVIVKKRVLNLQMVYV